MGTGAAMRDQGLNAFSVVSRNSPYNFSTVLNAALIVSG
jgi:hypothetical protein